MPPTEPAAPPETPLRPWRRRGLIALTALALPLVWTTYNIVNRGALYPYLLRRNRITYLESALLGLAFWSLGMEAARHASRGVRLVALTVLGVTAAVGIGAQTYFRTLSHEYFARPGVLFVADMPAIFTGFASSHAVVISLSDHGEARNEHHTICHSFDVYAEQIDIPLWIDAPQGSLAPTTIDHLRADAALRPVSTADVGATVIDLLGALDPPAFHPYTAALAGTSLLREAPGPRQVLLWNCPPSRACVAEAFGVIAWPLKLHYVGRELHYACHDLEADPLELSPLPKSRCEPLRAVLDKLFISRPDVPLN